MLPVNGQISNYSISQKKVSRLQLQNFRAITSSSHLLVVEKINLIALLLGHKQVTDVAIDSKRMGNVEYLLRQLGLPYSRNHYDDPQGVKHEWVQVAINQPVLQYVIQRRNELTVIEAGVLYGYPTSACLAYAGMLEKTGFDKTIAEHYLSGVFSKPYATREREHFERMWEDIAKASPEIVVEAEREYQLR